MITVVHPKDKTTAVLAHLYAGCEARIVDQHHTNKEVRHFLNHAHPFEYLMLLGHGSDKGLFSRSDDGMADFDRIIVNKHHAFYLKRQHLLIGIWCHARTFAEEQHLRGLFSGMFISELSEAAEYGVSTCQEELDVELDKFVRRLRGLLDERVHFSDIPAKLRAMDDVRSPLTTFNYNSIFFING